MTFDEILTAVTDLLQREGRVAYRVLKRRFTIDDEYVEDLKADLIDAKRLATDEDGKVLVWIGKDSPESNQVQGPKSKVQSHENHPPTPNPQHPAAERRQLTVMFCDLVGSTALSAQLDPEELRDVVRSYQETCGAVIRRYDGHIAQHLGDGLLVYFGYPTAHEDDAQRAVRAGLEIITALRSQVPSPLVDRAPFSPSPSQGEGRGEGKKVSQLQNAPHPSPLPQGARELQVRIGIHTGVVVIGEIGSQEKREMLALGETPNVAARIQGHARPDEVLISAATARLVEGLFECEDRGQPELKGVSSPLTLYRVRTASTAHSRFETAMQKGLTPLVGRDEELALLRRRWEQAKEGEGQVVLLSGEAGIGKSRLVQELKDAVAREDAIRIEFRCSPYHQNSALYPIIDHLQRLLQFAPDDAPQSKLTKLQQALARYRFPQTETLALFATLLSLPQPDGVQPLTWSPQKQKEKTQEALVAWVVEEAAQQVVYLVWEDLHWIDPSSLEVLTLLLQQVPTSRALVVLTYRPDFTPPWRARAHSTQLTLTRLTQQHVTALVNQVMATVVLSAEVVQQIVSRTDGVPLFVEELTKSVAESLDTSGRSSQQLAIPTTLHDSLMARLDRLGAAKAVAQLGATLGREFNYELLQAVSPLDATTLQQALQQLVDAELLYQRGLPPQATYVFKHALIQDTAYQSLLKSTRQQYHSQIAQVLEQRFPETVKTQPELVAHHYTEANLSAQGIPYWQQAGQGAAQRSANLEAVSHLTKALDLLKTLPDTRERNQQELTLQLTLGALLQAIKGFASPEVERVYVRARELCQQEGETAQLFPVLWGLWFFYLARAKIQTARETGEQLLTLAQSVQDTDLLLEAHMALGATLFHLGEFVLARGHLEQGIALYNPQKHHSHAFVYGTDPGVNCRIWITLVLWFLGYPDQALRRSCEAITLARETSHSFSLGFALDSAAWIRRLRREGQATQQQAETLITFASEQGFTQLLPEATMFRGWALSEQGQEEEGIPQIRQSLAAQPAMETACVRPHFLALLAEACGKARLTKEGLTLLDEALTATYSNVGRFYEAELYRLKGELTLQSQASLRQVKTGQDKSEDTSPQPLTSDPQAGAEVCFLKALEVARKQQAKSLELRASTSLAHLWQRQGKQQEAHKLLSEVYNWFTEGFDTKDLQEAKALVEELSH